MTGPAIFFFASPGWRVPLRGSYHFGASSNTRIIRFHVRTFRLPYGSINWIATALATVQFRAFFLRYCFAAVAIGLSEGYLPVTAGSDVGRGRLRDPDVLCPF
jgi:hypothetical protein